MKYEITLGNLLEIKMGFLKGKFRIMYSGMSNKNTFVLSPYIIEGYSGFSPSIYYSTSSTRIQILGLQFDVDEITPEYIVLSEVAEV